VYWVTGQDDGAVGKDVSWMKSMDEGRDLEGGILARVF